MGTLRTELRYSAESHYREVKGELPCGATLTAESTPGHPTIAIIYIVAGHDFCVGSNDRITLTFRKDGVQPLIDFLRRIEREL